MDLQNMDLKGGSLQISTEVIGKIARCAALEIEGVAEVSCGRQNKKVKDLLEIASLQSPVTVTMREGTADHAEPAGQLWRAHPLCGGKGTGECKVCCAEHDQCDGQPCGSGHCGSVRSSGRSRSRVMPRL